MSAATERWIVAGDDPANLHVVLADAPHMRVCFLTSDGPTENRARLIAAAPVLLAACKLILQHGRIDDSESRLNIVAAAIAAAEPQS